MKHELLEQIKMKHPLKSVVKPIKKPSLQDQLAQMLGNKFKGAKGKDEVPDDSSDGDFQKKYLKYKSKYLQLKKNN